MNQINSISEPLISVVMPVYNAEAYLAVAINSILEQTLQNFELIIVNDGSSDGSLLIAEQYQNSKIIIVNQSNRGIVEALNVGLSLARGEFIARMDADDISVNTRFEKQVHLLQSRALDICGSQLGVMDKNGRIYSHVAMPITDDWLSITLACTVPFAHGSVMMRRSFLESNAFSYVPGLVEDYSLWCSMYEHGAQMGNVNEELYIYRQHHSLSKLRISESQISTSNQRRQFVKKSFSSLKESIIRVNEGSQKYSIKEESFLLLASYMMFKENKDPLVFQVLKRVSFTSIVVALIKLLKGF
jgi:glycosyltransferase involved in cell wall biosynthesis